MYPLATFGVCTAGGYVVFDQLQKYRLNKTRALQASFVRDKVFMDFQIGDEFAGRVIFGLYSEHVPLTCENFLQLCKGYGPLSYKGSAVHKVMNNRYLVAGDNTTFTGSSMGLSIFGKRFPHENFGISFVQDGDLAMYSEGPNTNAAQFLITLRPMPRLQGQYTCFGTVLSGMRVIRKINEQATRMGRLVKPVFIVNCGVFDEKSPPPLPDIKDPNLTEEEFRKTNPLA